MITSSDLKNLLRLKYEKDYVCIDECKTGASFGHYRIIDFWAMKKSWTNPGIIACEIKVNRQDFLADDKWKKYLDYCNEFYFVAPKGIIEKDELPPEAGLLITSTNARLLYCKKKAPFRDVKIPDSIFRYILMWRASIDKEGKAIKNVDYWKKWLEDKREQNFIGYNVSKRLHQKYDEDVEEVRKKQRVLEREIESLKSTKEFLIQIGVSNEAIERGWTHEMKDQVGRKFTRISSDLRRQIDMMINNLISLKEKILTL